MAKYIITDDFQIEISTDEEAMEKAQLQPVIRVLVRTRQADNKAAELEVSALKAKMTETDKEIKKLHELFNSIPYLEE